MQQIKKVSMAVSGFLLIIPVAHANIAAETAFTDIQGHKNQTAIEYLFEKKIISGYESENAFKPENTINRAEILKILIGAKLGSIPDKDSYNNCFPDVTNEWFAPYVCYAKENKWVQGYVDGAFRPSKQVSRTEAVKMLVSIENYSLANSVSENLFYDVDNSQWYAPYLKAAKDRGLLEETSGNFGVNDEMKRGSFSEILYRSLIKNSDAAPKSSASSSRSSSVDSNSIPSVNNAYYPIDLMKTQDWEIVIEVKGDVVGDEPIFRVNRNAENYSVTGFMRNKKTGKIEQYFLYEDYEAGFDQQLALEKQTWFEVEECHYRYEYIREGFTCSAFVIPTIIDDSTVTGHQIHDWSTSISEDEYKVTVVSKGKTLKSCDVKAESKYDGKIYHVKGGEFFDEVEQFRCFESEADAQKSGYTKSYK